MTFDWDNNRVKLGQTWIPAQSLLSGATPLARALVAKHNDEGERINFSDETGAKFISGELEEM